MPCHPVRSNRRWRARSARARPAAIASAARHPRAGICDEARERTGTEDEYRGYAAGVSAQAGFTIPANPIHNATETSADAPSTRKVT